jgi:hypothetical protein
MDALPFPDHVDTGLGEGFHVGCNLASSAIGIDNSNLAEGTQVNWCLVDEHDETVCAYSAVIQGGAWRASLPLPYIKKLQAGKWRVVVRHLPYVDLPND